MLILNLPPIEEVRDVVLDMMPVEAPAADPDTIQQSVALAENLVAVLHLAASTTTTEAILKRMLWGIISTTEFADEDWHSVPTRPVQSSPPHACPEG
ncbi:hypothetical protein [Collimonas humicola]|uniref:hypothetical protein n=1 Tax=Collimonas humicola TaxID=2825886 RepID=UPI001B8C5C2B|nr:hypothetical protein [Collimonas humicola]